MSFVAAKERFQLLGASQPSHIANGASVTQWNRMNANNISQTFAPTDYLLNERTRLDSTHAHTDHVIE